MWSAHGRWKTGKNEKGNSVTSLISKIRSIISSKFSGKFLLKISQINLAVLLGTTLFLINNFSLVSSRFVQIVFDDFNFSSFTLFIIVVALHIFIISATILFSSFNKIVFRFVVFSLFLFSVLNSFIYNEYGIIIDQTSFVTAFKNRKYVGDFISFYALSFYLLFFFFLPIFLLSRLEIVKSSAKKCFLALLLPALFFTAAFCKRSHDIRTSAIMSYTPIGIIDSFLYYHNAVSDSANSIKLRKIGSIFSDISANRNEIKNLKVVLIIGESARSQNLSINGYERDTTPNLKKQNNLVNFSNVKPCDNMTSRAVSCMLSYKNTSEFPIYGFLEEESIITLFEKIGFKTAWLSTQKAIDDDNVLLLLGLQAQKHVFYDAIIKNLGKTDIHDEDLLPFLDKEIVDNEEKFIVMHTQGSHFIFDERYPDNFRKFTPVCSKRRPKKCDKQHLRNAYDNTILYTDHFISKVIKRLEQQNAILFYVSDHGQFLGERGMYYHGNPKDNESSELMVPAMLWMSDSILKKPFYRDKYSNAKAKTNSQISHDNLFDSLLDCSGLDSKFFNRNLSLCKK